MLKILVCCKGVPKGVRDVQWAEKKGGVEYKSNSFLMNEGDEYALDAALLWKRGMDAEVTALTVGGIRSQDILYMAIAKGADKAIRIDADLNESGTIARVLAEALREKGYDLILTGVESEDNMASQAGISLAERLNLSHAFAVTKVEFVGGQKAVKVTTELGGGVQEELQVQMPAVLLIQSGIAPLTYAALAKIMKARRSPISSISLGELGLKMEELEAGQPRIVGVFEPPQAENAEMISGRPEQIAETIMDKVKNVFG